MADTTSERLGKYRFRWSESDKAAFPHLARAEELWNKWLSANEPSHEQHERKLLMDLYVDYEASKHFGSEIRTAGRPEFAWFNSEAKTPIQSGDDYRSRTAPLEKYRMRMYKTQRTGDFGRAMFEFIVTGDVTVGP